MQIFIQQKKSYTAVKSTLWVTNINLSMIFDWKLKFTLCNLGALPI